MDEHVRFGGVVPEVASRAHVQAIGPAIVAACDEAKVLGRARATLRAGLVQLLLILILFVDDGLDFMLDLTAALALLPYLLAAAYMLKLTLTRETYGPSDTGTSRRSVDMAIAAVAVIYTVFLVWAAGWDKLLLSCILYAPGTILYVIARREQKLRVFRPAEAALFGVFLVGAIGGIIYLATGSEDIFDEPEHERHSYYVDDPTAHHHPDHTKGTS